MISEFNDAYTVKITENKVFIKINVMNYGYCVMKTDGVVILFLNHIQFFNQFFIVVFGNRNCFIGNGYRMGFQFGQIL